MDRDVYEICLLEIRQGLKEIEETLRHQSCADLLRFKEVIRLKKLVREELINFRMGKHKRNVLFIEYMGG